MNDLDDLFSDLTGGGLADLFAEFTAKMVPLVRYHRSHGRGWSFLCPDESCQSWQDSFETAQACRAGWFEHCDTRPHALAAEWPADVPFEPVYQMVAAPSGNSGSIWVEMHSRAVVVDMAGRVMQYETCLCLGVVADRKVDGLTPHRTLRGEVCACLVACPTCSRGPGFGCDRTFGHFDFKQHGPAVHSARHDAAIAEQDARRAAGDLRVPAPWRPELAPTARKPRKNPKVMTARLRVDVGLDHSDMWKSLVYEFSSIGRLSWVDARQTSCTILHQDAQSAELMRNLIVAFYGVPAGLVRVELVPADDQLRRGEVSAALTRADAFTVLGRAGHDTPEQHLVWAAGVISGADARCLAAAKLTKVSFARELEGGTIRGGRGYENNRAGFFVTWGGYLEKDIVRRKVPWSKVIGMIQGRIPSVLLAEMRLALEEVRSFPIYTREWYRALTWCADLGAEAWELRRPDDLVVRDKDRVSFARLTKPSRPD